MTKTIPLLFLALCALTSCDTTVIGGDTTVIIVGAQVDSIGVGNVTDGLGINDAPLGDGTVLDRTLLAGVWKLVEVFDGPRRYSVPANFEVEILTMFTQIAFLVVDPDPPHVPLCAGSIRENRTSGVTLSVGSCVDAPLIHNHGQIAVTIETDGTILTWSFDHNELNGLQLARRMSGVEFPAKTLSKFVFARSPRVCPYCSG